MRIILLVLIFSFSAPLSAQLMPSYKMTKKYSARELQEWLKKNVRPRFISPAKFSLTFQLSTGWTYNHDKLGSVSQVGAGTGRASNKYNVDLTIDYIYAAGRAKLVARTAFRNAAGLFGGTTSSLDLGRAFIGYNFTTHGPFLFRVDVGRKTLLMDYNSQMLFRGRSDGANIISSYLFEKIVNLRFIGGIYISDHRAFWITRGEIFNIANTGFYFDYVHTHWGETRPTRVTNEPLLNNLKYNISQFLFGWDYKPEWLNNDLKLFVALIENHGATRNTISHGSRESLAGYVGGQFGNAKKQNEFSIQVQFQFCQLQAIPPWDLSGIGTGRAPVSIFTATSARNVNGNTNYKGWQGKILYAITNQLILSTQLQRSVVLNHALGQPPNFTAYKLGTQYIF